MRVLVACECSGIVREAFRRRGHEAFSCDLKPAEDGSAFHIAGDVRAVLGAGWDLLIAHPECRYLCSSGLHRNKNNPARLAQTAAALEFVRELMAAPIARIVIENPIGRIGTAIRPADQYIQPYEFGEDASKRSGLWIFGLPALKPTERRPGRWVTHNGRRVERWSNQTDSGQNRLSPGPNRSADRARTYPGIAEAMAVQWGAA